ncbi:MAG: purine-binding chemotaxis protein CheW [Bacteroidota bacterium]|nr:purine-binding chemotaxis protein CheW [Bacteroidota bacterium]
MGNSIANSGEKTHYNEELQLVTFNIGSEEFGVDILNIQGINRMVEVNKIPNAPDFIEGIINLRGKVIPLVSLRRRLGIGEKQFDNHTRFIVVEIDNSIIGFIVDNVCEVLRINRNVTEPPPEIITGIDRQFITAVGKLKDRLLLLLDIEKVLTGKEKEEIQNMSI